MIKIYYLKIKKSNKNKRGHTKRENIFPRDQQHEYRMGLWSPVESCPLTTILSFGTVVCSAPFSKTPRALSFKDWKQWNQPQKLYFWQSCCSIAPQVGWLQWQSLIFLKVLGAGSSSTTKVGVGVSWSLVIFPMYLYMVSLCIFVESPLSIKFFLGGHQNFPFWILSLINKKLSNRPKRKYNAEGAASAPSVNRL